MQEAWNLYISAFRNIFDYENTAERKELNWFILFMYVCWFASMIFYIGCVSFMGNDPYIPVVSKMFFFYAAIYYIGHGLALISLVRRRFNLIAPKKSKIFFGSWVVIFLVELLAFISLGLVLIIAKGYINTFLFLPFVIIGQICNLLVIVTIIFLMIRKRAIC